jgi:hypothetical protein
LHSHQREGDENVGSSQNTDKDVGRVDEDLSIAAAPLNALHDTNVVSPALVTNLSVNAVQARVTVAARSQCGMTMTLD